MLEALMEGDANGVKRPKVFSSIAAAVEVIDSIAVAHGFKMCVSGEYVKCTRWGKPKDKKREPGKQERERKSQKCGCGFALHVCTTVSNYLRHRSTDLAWHTFFRGSEACSGVRI
jgi:hypothetical protein